MRSIKSALAAALLACGAVGASAMSYTGVTFFGDSLSDTGNIFLATGGAQPVAPYYSGRFSDGPVWTDYLAAGLGFSATPSLAGGNNYAFGGARTGTGLTPPGLLAQTGGLWAPTVAGAADPDRLYVLLGGGNDMRDARYAYQTNSVADQAGRETAAQTAAGYLQASLQVLAANGAKHVLIGNLPDLGRTPEAAALGLVAASTDAAARFNAQMPALMSFGQGLGLDMRFVDLVAVATAVFDDATLNGGAVYGITNISTPCGSFTGSIGIACSVSAYSDALHPTTRVHALFGDAALAAATAPIPEPQTYALLLLGLLALGWRVQRRAR